MTFVTITENYDNTIGAFSNYDTLDNLTQTVLDGQQHINIRSMTNVVDGVPLTMFTLSLLTDSSLNAYTQTDLEGTYNELVADNWTAGVAGPTSSIGNRNALVLDLADSPNSVSIIDNAVAFPQGISDWTLSLALPDFPLSQMDLVNSFIIITDRGFNSIELPLSTSATTLVNGDSEASWPISVLVDDEGNMVVPVEISIFLTPIVPNTPTVTIAGIRLLSPSWSPLELDSETRFQRLVPTVDRDGSIPTVAYPNLWRSDTPPGLDDPRPINVKLASLFYTGSIEDSGSITLYARGRSDVPQIQDDLDGISTLNNGIYDIGYTQTKLDALGRQPDYGEAKYETDAQTFLDTFTQAQIEAMLLAGYSSGDAGWQAFVERLPDSENLSYISANLAWDDTSTVITLSNSVPNETADYTFSTTELSTNSLYLFTLDVEEESVRATLDPVNGNGTVLIESRVLDSTLINDPFTFKRIAGRVGWAASLGDGDSYINSFKTEHLLFAEYQSLAFESYTPVDGMNLTVSCSPDIELYTGSSTWNGAIVGIDPVTSDSPDGSIYVISHAAQGLQVNPILIEDFTTITISFDLYWPADAIAANVYPFLYLTNGLTYIELGIGEVSPNAWQSFEVHPTAAFAQQTGTYSLIFLHTSANTYKWNIDNISVKKKTMGWSARSYPENPWIPSIAPWIDCSDILDSTSNGVVLYPRGNFLQTRGQAFSQGSYIDKIYMTPKYAQLGRLTFLHAQEQYSSASLDATPHGTQITASTVVNGVTNNYTWNAWEHAINTSLTFTATVSAEPPTITPVNYAWDFGDGFTASTSIDTTTHTYTVSNPSTIATVVVLFSDGSVTSTSLPLNFTS